MGNRCAKIYGHTNAEANSVTTVTKIDLEKHVGTSVHDNTDFTILLNLKDGLK